MKKLTALLLSLVLLLCCTACATSTDNGTSQNSTLSSLAINQATSSFNDSSADGTTSSGNSTPTNPSSQETPLKPNDNTPPTSATSIPDYSGQIFIQLNGNVPNFGSAELKTTGYESYGNLDSLGRVTAAVASLGKDTMPNDDEKRGDISSVKPTGWVQKQYDNVNGKYLYNRCHLIGWQLSAENANKSNLLTGTRYFNTEGMLPFENMVADYIKETGNHVAYRVTPVFEGNNLLCKGVQIEAYSVEDSGDGICFNVFCYNVQPDINIDYSTGQSSSAKEPTTEPTPAPNPSTTPTPPADTTGTKVWIPTNGGKKYHSKSSCSGMVDPCEVTKDDAISLGFDACGRCYK